MEIAGIGTQQTVSASSEATVTLSENFETFLILLTTQLQNQDPLSPVDSTEFTSQLSQFAAVEQAISANRNLELLIDLVEAQQAASAVTYLGKTIEIEGDTGLLRDGQTEWRYTLFDDAAETTITVTDEAGEIVFSGPGETTAGDYIFQWNGLSNELELQPDGLYRIEISARDEQGGLIATTTALGGVVSAVETIDGQQMLVVGDKLIPVAGVTLVRETLPPPPEELDPPPEESDPPPEESEL
jgi:flagellar basal-body rod modification protein FlgD